MGLLNRRDSKLKAMYIPSNSHPLTYNNRPHHSVARSNSALQSLRLLPSHQQNSVQAGKSKICPPQLYPCSTINNTLYPQQRALPSTGGSLLYAGHGLSPHGSPRQSTLNTALSRLSPLSGHGLPQYPRWLRCPEPLCWPWAHSTPQTALP